MTPRQNADAPVPRLASPADAPAIARLLFEFQLEFDDPSPEVEMLAIRYEKLLGDGEMTVLLVGDGPDGFAQLRFRPWVYDGLHSYLEELYVVPEMRGRGLGRTLLESAIETAREAGATNMELGTSEDDVAARALYERFGFANRERPPTGPVMYFYEREL